MRPPCTLVWSHGTIVHYDETSLHTSTLWCDLMALFYTMMIPHCTPVHCNVISWYYSTLWWNLIVHCGVISWYYSTLWWDLVVHWYDLMALLYAMMRPHCTLVHCVVISWYYCTVVWSHGTIVHYDETSLHTSTLCCDLMALLYSGMI